MTRKVYRTAQGKTVDLGAIELRNETVKAVGNMGVNARGDIVNAHNSVVETKNESVKKHYKKQTKRTNVVDDAVAESRSKTKAKSKKVKTPTVVEVEPEKIIEPDIVPQITTETQTIKEGGLAGAIAKAKSVKQEPVKTPRQLAQEKAGVNKI